MSEDCDKIKNTKVYFKEKGEDEFKELDCTINELGCTANESIIFEEPLSNKSGEFEVELKDKNFIRMNQLKSKRLKKKYYKRTILYQITKIKRW